MSQGTKAIAGSPEAEPLDPEVVEFRAQFDEGSPLDEIVRGGARKMLQVAIEGEVEAFLEAHSDRRDDEGRRLVVRGWAQADA